MLVVASRRSRGIACPLAAAVDYSSDVIAVAEIASHLEHAVPSKLVVRGHAYLSGLE